MFKKHSVSKIFTKNILSVCMYCMCVLVCGKMGGKLALFTGLRMFVDHSMKFTQNFCEGGLGARCGVCGQ